jgi:leucyl aminopeptidase
MVSENLSENPTVLVEGGAPLLQVEAVAADTAGREAVVVAVPSEGDPVAFTDGVLAPADLDAARAFLAGLGAKASEVGTVRELARPGATPARLFFVGTGAASERADSDLAAFRRAGASLARSAREVATLTVWSGPAGPELGALVEGLVLGAYRFPAGSHATPPALTRVEVVGDAAGVAVDAALRTVGPTCWARDLTNTRSSTKSPQWVADRAVEFLAPRGVEVVVRDDAWLEANGFGGVLAVGGGSSRRPRLVEAHYRPDDVATAPVLVVGKGIVYDTGGYNLKPGTSMATMYTDMAGGAAALAALAIVADLRLPVAVTVLVPLADNVVSAEAYRPGDVVVHHGGRTSEITNTDAEGRLVLGDALAYGVETVSPRAVVDIATLTGAMAAALGGKIAGVIGDDQPLVDALLAAGAATGEKLWQLPLGADEYASEIDSPVADAVNSAGGPPGAITAALFLRPFAGGLPWAHLDIAGTARAKSDDGVAVKGATGFGARLLAAWLGSLV